MYDELVKMLRTCAERDSCIGGEEACPYLGTGVCDNKAEKAADAIEKLRGLCASQSKDCSEAVAKYLELWVKQPRWIPVTERLPESVRKSYLCLTDTGYHCEARWTNNVYGVWTSSMDNEWGWSIADVPQFRKITHWMPLPEPPKENADV